MPQAEPTEKITRHHRRPRSLKGNGFDVHHQSNISFVPEHRHRAWHTLFGNKEAMEIAKLINDVYLDPQYFFVVVKRWR